MMYFPIHPLFPIFFILLFPVFSAASASFEKRVPQDTPTPVDQGNVPQIQDGFTPLQTRQIMDAFQDVFLIAGNVVDQPQWLQYIHRLYFSGYQSILIKSEASP